MKKKMIAAGAASLALAAMPVVGVFAEVQGGPFVDIIQATIAESCTFGRGTIANKDAEASVANYHADGESWTLNTNEAGTPTQGTDTLAAVSITPAATTGSETSLGHSKFYVICNDADGYQVTVATTGFSLPTGKTQVNPWAYSTSITSPATAAASYWRIVPSDAQKPSESPAATTNYSDIANNVVSTRSSAENGHDFSVEYKAFALTGQDAGTYKATATYTAAQL